MSLINQVLQDLEKRHASGSERNSLPPQVRAVAGRPQRPPVSLFVIVGILVVAAAVAAWLYFGGVLVRAPAVPVTQVPPSVQSPTPVPALAREPVEAEILVPASRLSDELSFVPEPRLRKEAARASAPATPKPQVPEKIPPEFRAAIEPTPASKPVDLAVPVTPAVPASQAPPAVEPVAQPSPVAPSSPERGSIDKQVRDMSIQQRAEVAFRKGVSQLQEARVVAAEASFREALRVDPQHVGARQALLGLLIDAKRNDEAEQLLKQALVLNPRQPRHAMVLARLEVERGEVAGAVNTLVGTLPYVQSDAEYYAFLAALLQKEDRHRETVDYYRAALRISPGNAVWLMGLGISLRANSQFGEARDAFQRALDTKQLNGDLLTFTERQLREMGVQKK